MAYERTISIAFDKVSGEILEADELFKSYKEAFAIRRQSHLDEIELFCCECRQKLVVASSKYDRLHFRHKKHAEPCILKDENLTPAELEEFSQIFKSKESERHKQLKAAIAARLAGQEGVDTDSIFVDNKFLTRGNEKRRPDVYCKYRDRELVFEIQLSQLSLRYILNRFEFYKKHGIYLIWILDNFNLHREKPSQLERDIKYLTKYQSFFKLDEDSQHFKLSCEYKFPFLTSDNTLLTKWKNKSVALDELNFDTIDFQVFYYNFGDNEALQTAQQKRNAEAALQIERDRIFKLREEQRKEEERREQQKIKLAEELRLKSAEMKVDGIINRIAQLKRVNVQSYESVGAEIDQLSEYETTLFNQRSKIRDLSKEGNPFIHRWIEQATLASGAFILFILGQENIEVDVNCLSNQGLTVCQHLFKNDTPHKYSVMRLALKRGYILTEEDEFFLKSSSLERNIENEATSVLYKICSSVENKQFVDWILDKEKLIFILESVRQNRIIGFAYKNWISFANNAIQYYGTFFVYIERAFRYYGLWDKIKLEDKKGTFENKLSTFYKNFPKQSYEAEEVIRLLYPEIFL